MYHDADYILTKLLDKKLKKFRIFYGDLFGVYKPRLILPDEIIPFSTLQRGFINHIRDIAVMRLDKPYRLFDRPGLLVEYFIITPEARKKFSETLERHQNYANIWLYPEKLNMMYMFHPLAMSRFLYKAIGVIGVHKVYDKPTKDWHLTMPDYNIANEGLLIIFAYDTNGDIIYTDFEVNNDKRKSLVVVKFNEPKAGTLFITSERQVLRWLGKSC